MVVPEGVDYAAFDGSLANLLFMIAAPAEGADVHLEALSRLSTLLMNPGFKEALWGQADKDEFLRIIDEAETERFGAPEGETGQNAKEDAETGAKQARRQRRVPKQTLPPVTGFWLLRPAPPVLPTPIWQLRTWRIRERSWGLP